MGEITYPAEHSWEATLKYGQNITGADQAPRHAQAMFDDFATAEAEPLQTITFRIILQ